MTIALVAAAACGGGRAATPTEPANPEAESRAEDLAELKAWSDRACACTDDACAARVDDEIEGEMHAHWDPADASSPDDTTPLGQQIASEVQRLFQCLGARHAGAATTGRIAIAKLTQITDALCACQNAACVAEAKQAIEEYDATVNKLPVAPRLSSERDEVLERLKGCFAAGSEIVVSEIMIGAKKVRSDACDCHDAECGTAELAHYQQLLLTFPNVPVQESGRASLTSVSGEIVECLMASGVTAAQIQASMKALADAVHARTRAE